MNSKTADRLNYLLERSEPVGIYSTGVVFGGYEKERSRLADELSALAHAPQNEERVTAAEVQRCAERRIQVDLCAPTFTGYLVRAGYQREPYVAIPWAHTARLHAAIQEQAAAIVKADNERRLAAYETYRIACAQNVAVPPA